MNPGKTPVVCTKCAGSNYRLTKVGSCVWDQSSSCSNGTYFDPNKYDDRFWDNTTFCIACPQNCTACSYVDILQYPLCSFCKSGYKLTISGTCVNKTSNESSCPVGTYEQELECKDCPTNCAQCSYDVLLDAVACQACRSGYIYDAKSGCQAEKLCDKGFYTKQKVDPTDTACYPCDKNCAYCYFDKTELIQKCGECLNSVDYVLNNKGVCMSVYCPVGQVFNPNVDSGCESCPVQC